MVGNILLIIIVLVVVWGLALAIGADSGTNGILIGTLISIIITIVIIGIDIWYINGTESGKRMVKDTQSNFNGGINRSVKVYDINGNLLENYEGKFDIEYYDTHLKFDDENGKRHIIYFTTGTVITDELEEEK